MTQKEIQNSLQELRDQQQAYFAIKQFNSNEDGFIEANRNGILVFCHHLLESIDKEHLQKEDSYDIPDSFWDDSDVSLYIRIREGNKNRQEYKESIAEQAGCFFALAASAVVFIVGIVTSFRWLFEFLN